MSVTVVVLVVTISSATPPAATVITGAAVPRSHGTVPGNQRNHGTYGAIENAVARIAETREGNQSDPAQNQSVFDQEEGID